MKNFPVWITFLLIFIISIFLFTYMSIPLGYSEIVAENGVLDLRGVYDFEQTIFPLSGQWEFYYGELLFPIDYPQEEFATIPVPSSWEQSGYPHGGYSAYRIVLYTDKDTLLTMHFPTISEAASVYVDDELLFEKGVVGKTSAESKGSISDAYIVFETKGGVTDIVVQTSNFRLPHSGISLPIKIGINQIIMNSTLRIYILYGASIGGILLVGIYHLVLYFLRKNESIYLLFSILCFVIVVRFAFSAEGIVDVFRSSWDGVIVYRIFHLFYFTGSLLIAYFTLYVSEAPLLKYKFFRYHGYLMITLPISAIMPLKVKVMILYSLIIVFPAFIYAIVSIIKAVKRTKNSYLILYLLSLIVFIIVAPILNLFLKNELFMGGLPGHVVLVLAQMAMLSKKYADAFTAVEDINQNLEQLVEQRTNQLSSTNQKLLVSQNSLREMLGYISHDLRTPLTSLSQNLELLQDDNILKSKEDERQFLSIAYQKNLDVQKLIKILFTLTRMETGQMAYLPDWISLKNIIQNTQSRHEQFIISKNIHFVVNYSGDNYVWVDEDKLESVLDNLIYNAVSYTQEGGTISLSATVNMTTAEIYVKDTGIGISPEHIPYLFDKFYQVSDARNGKGHSGLGLYIVKNITESMEGTVSLESTLGLGSNFKITLKAKQ